MSWATFVQLVGLIAVVGFLILMVLQMLINYRKENKS